jgi:hypothetical protein
MYGDRCLPFRSLESMGDMRNSYIIVVGKPEDDRLLGNLRRRWEANIKMDHKEILINCEDTNWINLGQDTK